MRILGSGTEDPIPVRQGPAIEDCVRGAFLTQVDLDYDHRCLRLRLLLRERLVTGERDDEGKDVWLRLPDIINLPHIEAFFFGRKLKLVGEHLDQVLELKEKADGCAIQLLRAGRVRIRTSVRPSFEAT